MWRIQGVFGRAWSRCHGSAPLRLSQSHHVEDEVINSSILTSGRHVSDSSSQRSHDEQKKQQHTRFCYAGLPRYTALDAVGWGAAAVLFMQMCRRIHSQFASHTDQNLSLSQIRDAGAVQKCSYQVLRDILSHRTVLSHGMTVRCLQGAIQSPQPNESSGEQIQSTSESSGDEGLTSAQLQEQVTSAPLFNGEAAASSFEQPNPKQEHLTVEEASENFRSLSNSSVPVILNIIGLESAKGGDYETAFSCFLVSARHDYSKAQFNVGVCYEKGRGVTADHGEALRYYKQAALAGHHQAQYRYAKLILTGRGQQSSRSDANTTTALNFLQAAADAGLTEAQLYLGVVLSQAPDCDEKKSVYYLKLAAHSGDSRALLMLAQCYDRGFAVSPCVRTAVALYQQAAARGNQQARHMLRDRHGTVALRSIRSAPCFSRIVQTNLKSVFPREADHLPLHHCWSTGSLSSDSSHRVWKLGV